MKSTSSAAFGVAAGVATGSWSNAATSDLVRTFCRPEWFLLEIARLEAARLHTTEPPISKQSALRKTDKACCLLEYPFLLGRRRGRVEFLVEVEQAVTDDALGHKVNECVPDELACADRHADGPLPGPKACTRYTKQRAPEAGAKRTCVPSRPPSTLKTAPPYCTMKTCPAPSSAIISRNNGLERIPAKLLHSPWIFRALIWLNSCIRTKMLKTCDQPPRRSDGRNREL